MLSPLLLSSRLEGTNSLTVGQVRTINDTQALANPEREPMLLDEIRFEVFSVASGGFNQDLGGVIWVKLDLGRTPLTHGFIPLWLFGKQLDPVLEMGLGSVATGSIPIVTADNGRRFYTWRLPKPLYVWSNEFVQPTFRYNTNLFSAVSGATNPSNAAVDVRITYSCRTLPHDAPVPRNIPVPWVAAWSGPAMAIGVGAATTYSAETTESNLVNPLNGPVKLQRFMGRIANIYNDSFAEFPLDLGSEFLQIRAFNSLGRIAIRTFTPFHHIFGRDKAWDVNAVLPPKAFFKFQLRARNLDTILQTANPVAQLPQLAMIGWRDVELNGA